MNRVWMTRLGIPLALALLLSQGCGPNDAGTVSAPPRGNAGGPGPETGGAAPKTDDAKPATPGGKPILE